MWNKIITRLDAIGKDKYQHIALGAVLAFVSQPAVLLHFWVGMLISGLFVTTVELCKEYVKDAYADWWDIAATYFGAGLVWATAIITHYVSSGN